MRNRPLAALLLAVAIAFLVAGMMTGTIWMGAVSGIWGAAAYVWWRGTPASRR